MLSFIPNIISGVSPGSGYSNGNTGLRWAIYKEAQPIVWQFLADNYDISRRKL